MAKKLVKAFVLKFGIELDDGVIAEETQWIEVSRDDIDRLEEEGLVVSEEKYMAALKPMQDTQGRFLPIEESIGRGRGRIDPYHSEARTNKMERHHREAAQSIYRAKQQREEELMSKKLPDRESQQLVWSMVTTGTPLEVVAAAYGIETDAVIASYRAYDHWIHNESPMAKLKQKAWEKSEKEKKTRLASNPLTLPYYPDTVQGKARKKADQEARKTAAAAEAAAKAEAEQNV